MIFLRLTIAPKFCEITFFPLLVGEGILTKKPLNFRHCPKGGGAKPKTKNFGGVFVGLLLDITEERGLWGLNLFQKCWGSFEVVLGIF